MPALDTDKPARPVARRPSKRTAAHGKVRTTLPESMLTGKASPAKARWVIDGCYGELIEGAASVGYGVRQLAEAVARPS